MEDVMSVTTTEPVKSPATDGAPTATVAKPAASAKQRKPKSAKGGRKWLLLTAAIVLVAAAYYVWKQLQPAELPEGFVSSNGRIEATEIDIATKIAGRLAEEFVGEGDLVSAKQILARVDTDALNAQLREAQADLRRAKKAVETANSGVAQRESEMAATEAVVLQRDAEFDLATQNYNRAAGLVTKSAIAKEEFDTKRAALHSAKAAVSRAKADVAAATAAISTAKSQVIESEAAVIAAEAKIERLQADINDCTLKAPRDGRVQFRVAQPGEVLPSGGKVLNMVDLADVYMTFFLPTEWAGRVQLGAETRIVLDAAPDFVIPAKVTFVADVAQFTPKTVETAEERQKLTFRIKAHIPPDLLKNYVRDVKTGLPGVAYVQLDPQAEWPAHLAVKLPEQRK
jgi:HlyD family secretion protein